MREKKIRSGKKRFSWKNVTYILRLAWECDKSIYLLMAVYTVLSAIQPFIGIFAPKLLIDELIGERRIPMLVLLLVVFLVLAIIVSFFTEYCLGRYFAKRKYFILFLERKLDEKNINMKFECTEDPETMEKLGQSHWAINSWGRGMAGMVEDIFLVLGKLLAFFGYIGILFTLHPLILVLLFLNVGVVWFFKSRAKKREIDILPDISYCNRRTDYLEKVMGDFTFGKDGRIYHMGEWLTNKAWKLKKVRIQRYYDLMKACFLPEGANSVFLFFREAAVYAYLIYKFIAEGMSIGDFTMYFSTVAGFTDWMVQIVESLVNIKGQSAFAEIYRNYLDTPEEETIENPLPIPPGPYTIEFQHVTFRYPRGSREIYHDLCLTIPAGQRLAIVGINGAGKTTFVKLLARLYDPTGGRILLNGIDIRKFDRMEYWKLFSVVFQEIRIFPFTVSENITFSDSPDADKLENAIQLADISEKIHSLPKGQETKMLKILDESGVEFSGGENQRLALARALYKGGSIVALDEPTAALDALAESAIYESFNQMVKDKTAVYISHRLASTRFCDQIAFFENGAIVEYGTHEELMCRNGKYADMFQVQAHYYQENLKTADDAGIGGEADA